MKNVCLLVGFSGDFRHKFYTQKEDPGIPYERLGDIQYFSGTIANFFGSIYLVLNHMEIKCYGIYYIINIYLYI